MPDSIQRKAWIEALRLRTLPLSAAGVVVAAGIAAFYRVFSPLTFILMLAMVLTLQVDANFADEYGDLANGADTDDRLGPKRGLQRGDISKRAMRRAMVGCGVLALCLATALILTSFGDTHLELILIFAVLAVFSCAGAVFYTVGKNAYGYHALGDVACLFFFGLLAVMGGFFLYTARAGSPTLIPLTVLPAIGLGSLVCGVLNLNNMRDITTDKAAGKITVATLLGPRHALAYHCMLIGLGMVGLLSFPLILGITNPLAYLFVVLFIPLGKQLLGVLSNTDQAQYDRFMKPLSVTTLFISIVFALCLAFLTSAL